MAVTGRGGVFEWTNLMALRTAPDKKIATISWEIRMDARRNCPVDTGRLRDSIHVRSERVGNGGLIEKIYSDVEYAAYQEYGTRHIPARAFMSSALARARRRYGGS